MKVHINNSSHLKEFIRLNELWIVDYFTLEEADKNLSEHPEKIIEDGGYVFSISSKEQVIAVCALFQKARDSYELARMTVHPDYQGQGLADYLIEVCFKQLDKVNAKKVYLISNSRLKAAIKLYQKHGFITTHQGPHPDYLRADIVMEKNLQG